MKDTHLRVFLYKMNMHFDVFSAAMANDSSNFAF